MCVCCYYFDFCLRDIFVCIKLTALLEYLNLMQNILIKKLLYDFSYFTTKIKQIMVLNEIVIPRIQQNGRIFDVAFALCYKIVINSLKKKHHEDSKTCCGGLLQELPNE